MPRRIRRLLEGGTSLAIETIVAEDPAQMKWLSQLYSDPNIRIFREDTKVLATHLLIIVRYTYPRNYLDTLEKKRGEFLQDSDKEKEFEGTLEDTFGIQTQSSPNKSKKELGNGRVKAIGYTNSR